jgi:hypothetical protein
MLAKAAVLSRTNSTANTNEQCVSVGTTLCCMQEPQARTGWCPRKRDHSPASGANNQLQDPRACKIVSVPDLFKSTLEGVSKESRLCYCLHAQQLLFIACRKQCFWSPASFTLFTNRNHTTVSLFGHSGAVLWRQTALDNQNCPAVSSCLCFSLLSIICC